MQSPLKGALALKPSLYGFISGAWLERLERLTPCNRSTFTRRLGWVRRLGWAFGWVTTSPLARRRRIVFWYFWHPLRARVEFFYTPTREGRQVLTIVTHPHARGLASPSSTAAAELVPTPIRHPRSSGRWAPSRNFMTKKQIQVSGLSLILFAYE